MSTIEEGVNPFTDRLTRLLLLGKGRWLRPALLVANLLLRTRVFRRRVLRRLARLQES